jgi:hypothetical protein
VVLVVEVVLVAAVVLVDAVVLAAEVVLVVFWHIILERIKNVNKETTFRDIIYNYLIKY